MKKIIQKVGMATLGAFAPAIGAMASFKSVNLDNALQQVDNTLSNSATVGRFINIATGIVFIIGIVLVAWGYASRGKGDGQSNDKMINAGIYAIIAVAIIQVFKLLLGAS